MPTTLTNGIQLPDKGSVDWYNSMQSNYNLIDTHLGNTDTHVTAEDKANWNSKQGSLSQAQLDAIAQVATNTNDIATLQSGKANASHTHSSSDITDIDDYATKQYVDNSISGLVDSAPNALDTLNELAAALNDDANFATTVTNALSAKANSADLATVATSGSYNDLSNKPTINDSTITIQKNGSTIDTFTTNGSAKTINIPVPTKTSDLTNDSNFVDTSNAAVSSGITSAKVTDYDTHIADTDIHVTTADKNKWNNNTYVFRYSSTALVASSTNSNTLLDNTDNLKVGDKVIDSNGVLFSITAIDTANSTFTVGSALVDLALDANVVHTSGNENVAGIKNFTDDTYIKSLTINGVACGDILTHNTSEFVNVTRAQTIGGQKIFTHGQTGIGRDLYHFAIIPYGKNTPPANISYQYIWFTGNSASQGFTNSWYGGYLEQLINPDGSARGRWLIQNTNENRMGIQLSQNADGSSSTIIPAFSNIDLGTSTSKWKSFNGINPGALSLPDLANGVDISSYITHLDKVVNSYTPSVNGWISIRVKKTSLAHTSVMMYQTGGLLSSCETTEFNISGINLPVIANQNVEIYIIADSLASAKFYPCQGNV